MPEKPLVAPKDLYTASDNRIATNPGAPGARLLAREGHEVDPKRARALKLTQADLDKAEAILPPKPKTPEPIANRSTRVIDPPTKR